MTDGITNSLPVSISSALVIGGAGFIGTHLIDELLASGVKVTATDHLSLRGNEEALTYVEADIRKPLTIEGDFDVIFNLAAVHRTPGHPGGEYYETNIAGAMNVTEFARERGIKRIVFTSSISTYGPGEDLKDEDTPLTPVSDYGKSKKLAEEIHRNWLEESDDNQLVVVRPAVTFGYGEGGNFDRLLGALRQRRFVYPGRTDTIKSCGHVTDLVGSMLWALGLGDRELTYNFAYPERTTIKQVAEAISTTFDVPAPPATLPFSAMKAAAKPFDLLDKVGLKTGINTPRIMKLVESTNVYPKVLVERGYKYRTDLRTGVELWKRETDAKKPLSV